MPIEAQLQEIASAIAANTKALQDLAKEIKSAKVAVPAPAAEAKKEAPRAEAPKPAEPAKKKVEITLDQVRDKIKAYAAVEGKPAAVELIKEFGADVVSDIDPDKFEAIMADPRLK